MNEEIIEYKDLYYKDKNYIIFRNKFDDLVLKKKNIYIDYKYNFLKLANYNEKSSNIILHNNIIKLTWQKLKL